MISQNPVAGTSVSTGSAVGIVVSLGPVQVAVPDVVGLSQSSADPAIVAAGLVVGTVSTANSNTVPAGDVISQNPVAGTSVSAGSAVDIVVSLGPVQVAVPDVVGLMPVKCRSCHSCCGSGSRNGQHRQLVTRYFAGDVISQNPVAGTSVSAGSAGGHSGVVRAFSEFTKRSWF